MMKRQIKHGHLIFVGLIFSVFFFLPVFLLNAIMVWFFGDRNNLSLYFNHIFIIFYLLLAIVGIFLSYWGENITRGRGIIIKDFHNFFRATGYCINCNYLLEGKKPKQICPNCGYKFKSYL